MRVRQMKTSPTGDDYSRRHEDVDEQFRVQHRFLPSQPSASARLQRAKADRACQICPRMTNPPGPFAAAASSRRVEQARLPSCHGQRQESEVVNDMCFLPVSTIIILIIPVTLSPLCGRSIHQDVNPKDLHCVQRRMQTKQRGDGDQAQSRHGG